MKYIINSVGKSNYWYCTLPRSKRKEFKSGLRGVCGFIDTISSRTVVNFSSDPKLNKAST